MRDYQGAIPDYNRAIVLDPNNALAYNRRGIARYNLGDEEGGCLDFAKASELGHPGVAEIVRNYCN